MINSSRETHTRSMLKSVSYRVYSSFFVTPLVSYMITHNMAISFAVGTAEFLVKPFTYYIFERFWAHIVFGYGATKHDLISKIIKR